MRNDTWAPTDPVALREFAELLVEAGAAESVEDATVGLRTAERRVPSFPTPVERVGRSKRYELGPLLRWWNEQHGGDLEPSPTWCLSHALRHAAVEHPLSAKVAGLAELISLTGETTVPPAPTSVDLGDHAFRRLGSALQAMLAEGAQPAALAERVITGVRLVPQPGAATSTTGGLIELLVAIADADAGEIVLDSACGEGGLLLAVHRHAPGVRLVGREVDPTTWWIATVRHHLHGTGADLGDRPADSSAARSLPLADVVVLDPPFSSSTDTDPAGRWLFHRWLGIALEALGPGGRAVIALPERTVSRRQEWSRVDRHVRSIIVGPDRMRDDATDAIAIWELSAEPVDEQVLVVDVSRNIAGSSSRKCVDDATLGALAVGLRAWRRSGDLPRNIDAQRVEAGPESIAAALVAAAGNDEEHALELAKALHELIAGDLRHLATGELTQGLARLVRRLEKSSSSPP